MRNYWLGALTIALFAFTVWLFFALFEQYEEEVDAGYSKEARLNPYLAAQYFLEKNNTKVHEQTVALDFSQIPTEDTVFLSKVDSMLLSESQIEKAMTWVEKGGFLILGVGQEIEGHDSFLSRFDIEPEYVKKSGGKAENNTEELAEKLIDALELTKEPERYTINLADSQDQISVQILDRIVLRHPDAGEGASEHPTSDDTASPYTLTASVSDTQGPRLLQFDYGKGGFTVLSSTKFWQNKSIGKADHAYLLAYLMPKESALHLYYNITAPSLWELLTHYFFELLAACILLLVLWLWRVSIRVQGTKLVVDGQRRDFTEHLTASAEFLAAKKQYLPLLTPIKEDITAQMQLYHPGFTQLDAGTQISVTAQRTGIPEEVIQKWIGYTTDVNNQQELIDALKLGNAIRRKL